MAPSATSDDRTPSDDTELNYVRTLKEITEARFLNMLNLMPPRDFYGSTGRQTFKLSELLDDDTATIFCQVDGRCFELRDDCRLTHREILAKCSAR
jgi:hypothetical protein